MHHTVAARKAGRERGAGDMPGTQHLKGAGDHHTAALRLQVNGSRRVQSLGDAPFWRHTWLNHACLNPLAC